MSIKLWDWLEDLNWLVGADFPEADEDALWRCSDAWAAAAADIRRMGPSALTAGQQVTASLGGDSGTAFSELWRQYTDDDGLVERIAAVCDQLAGACDNAAVEVEYAKIQYIAALTVLAAALAYLTAALFAGGVSALGMPAAVAAAQFTIRLVLMRLVTAMAAGALMNVALDGLAQSIQILAHHRDSWDVDKTVRSAEDGAIYGAAGGGVFLAAGRFAPGLLRSALRITVPLAATGAIGGVAAPLVHGELPTGRDFLLSLTSGIAGGLGPDLVHGRASVPDLSRLDTLRPSDVDPHGAGGLPADTALRGLLADAGRLDPADGLGGEPPSGVQPANDHPVVDGGQSSGGPATETAPATNVASAADAAAPRSLADGVPLEDKGQLAGAAVRGSDTSPPAGAGPDQLPGSASPDQVGAAPVRQDQSVIGSPAERMPVQGRTDPTTPQPVGGPAGTFLSGAVPMHNSGPTPSALGSSGPPPALHALSPTAGAGAPGASAAGDGAAIGTLAPNSGAGVATAAPGLTALTGIGALPDSGVGLGPRIGSEVTPATVPAGGSPESILDGDGWLARSSSAVDPPGWHNSKGASLTGSQNQMADALLQRARDAEPRITSMVRDIAGDVGGVLWGEENKFKTEDSLKAKLAPKLHKRAIADVLPSMKDTLRYTIGLTEDRYAVGAQEAVGLLLENGFRPVSEFRSWLNPSGYLGYNTAWSDPVTGHVFEVQFHTEKSFIAKSISHGLFDQIRRQTAAKASDPAWLATKATHDAYFVDVPIPPGAGDVRLPRDVPLYDPKADLPSLPRPRSADIPQLPLMDQAVRAATDVEALDLGRRDAFQTRAGLGFYTAGDDVRGFAGAVHPTDGYVTLDLHGSSRGFLIDNRRLTADQFADVLLDLQAAGVLNLPAGVGIKLISCDTATGGQNSPAAILARRLGVEVVAPDQPVWTALDGNEVVSSPTLVNGNYVPTDPPDGTWHRFFPGSGRAGSGRAGGDRAGTG